MADAYDEQAVPDASWLLDRLWRYIDRFGFRMTQSSGTLDATFVSLREVGQIMRGGGSPGVAQQLGVDPPAISGERPTLWSSDRLARLARDFGLSPLEVRLLAAAAAAALSVDVARLYTFAWADFTRKRPSVGFLAELVADGPVDALEGQTAFLPDGRLVGERLIELVESSTWGEHAPLIHRDVTVPEPVITFLRGQPPRVGHALIGLARFDPPPADGATGPPDDPSGISTHPVERLLAESLGLPDGDPRALVQLLGELGTGRRALVERVCAAAGRATMTVALGRMPDEPAPCLELVGRVVRDAMMHRRVLLLLADDLEEDSGFERALVDVAGLLQRARCPVVVVGTRALAALGREVDTLVDLRMPLPPEARQRTLWREALAAHELVGSDDLPTLLALRFNTSPGNIRRAVRDARRRLVLEHGRAGPIAVELHDIAREMRRRINHALEEIATPVDTRRGWSDMVLQDETREILEEVVLQARYRSKVFDQWGLGEKYGGVRGLACLFSGPPGTGKTMAAGVLARELGQELYRIDLSRVVSKWVGETEKNLARVFDEAEKAQIILLFDEADSLFAKRTEVKASQDRFANMEVNFLLQRMEDYDGMSILTTNFEQSLDDALKRRLRFRVHFPEPGPEARLRLWEMMIPEKIERAGDLQLEKFARRYSLTGAFIRSVVSRAAFYAAAGDGVLTHALLDRAIRNEMRDMGRI